MSSTRLLSSARGREERPGDIEMGAGTGEAEAEAEAESATSRGLGCCERLQEGLVRYADTSLADLRGWYYQTWNHHLTLLPVIVCLLSSVYMFDLAITQMVFMQSNPAGGVGIVGLAASPAVLLGLQWGSFPFHHSTALIPPPTYFTYAFHHFNIYHLGTNLLLLLATLRLLEAKYGTFKMSLLFLPPLFAGSLYGWLFYHPAVPTASVNTLAGVSAVAYGYVGVMVGDAILNWGQYRERWVSLLVVVVAVAVGVVLDGAGVTRELGGQVAVMCHVAGVTASILSAILLLPNPIAARWERFLKPVCLVLLVTFMVAPAVYMAVVGVRG